MTMPICKYRNVSERDMDLLFMEAFATDPDFCRLFIDKTENAGKEFVTISAERSKIDSGLGESDITVIYETDGTLHALLIEDKIDAIAMPNQHERYIKRGQKGKENGEYDAFDIFIVCPKKYRETNEEAAKYELFVSYEECRDYFASRSDTHSKHRFQQISQAIETMKAEYKVDINEIAVDSFKKYLAYQEIHFPRLKSLNNVNKKTINGWWPFFATGISPNIYIIHKTNKSYVDLTINNAGDRIAVLSTIEKWLHESGHERIRLAKTGKSAAFRINVPAINMGKPFENWKMGDLDACFEAIQELADLAAMFAVINEVIFRGSK